MASSSLNRLRVGYAFSPGKEKSVVRSSLVEYANLHGVDLVHIDLQIPLIHQAPFHCIFHKLYDESWYRQLREFTSEYPNVVVVDPPELVSPLHDRASMLEVVNHLKIPLIDVKIEVPKQVVVYDSDQIVKDDLNTALFSDLGLKFPVIAKSLEANGSTKSHEMCLVFNSRGLKELTTPVVLQEFVNHGGVIFKVYVAGEQAVCVKRKSLPNISKTTEELEKMDYVMKFSQISRIQNQDQTTDDQKCNSNSSGAEKDVEMPPENIVTEISRGLREAMRLRLFNFDMIRNENNTYFVIDINYLPGYAVMPNYESFLTNFFKDVAKIEKVKAPMVTGVKGDQEEDEARLVCKRGNEEVNNLVALQGH